MSLIEGFKGTKKPTGITTSEIIKYLRFTCLKLNSNFLNNFTLVFLKHF